MRYCLRLSVVLYLPIPDPSRPAQLLSQLARYPNPSLWGFPLKSALILAEYDKILPPDSDDENDAHFFRYCSNYFSELENQCDYIWSSPKVGASVREVHSMGKARLIIAIVKCTHPDDRLLPPADKIEEMRKVVVGLGFKGEPGWFNLSDQNKDVAQNLFF